MHHFYHKTAVTICCALFLLVFAGTTSNAQQTKPIDPANMDTSVNPADDFFQYANGGWVKNNPIPADQNSWGSFNELREKNMVALHAILEDAAKTDAKKGSNLQKVGDLYRSGMDSAAIEADGVKPLKSEFDKIDAIKTLADIQAEIAHLQAIGINVPFGVGSGQDAKDSKSVIATLGQTALGLPDREYYTKTDDKSVKLRDQYVEHITKMMTLLGDAPAAAAEEATTLLAFETQLSKSSMNRTERRDPDSTYHKMTLKELDGMTPNFSWSGFFHAVGADNVTDVNVAQPKFIKEIDNMLTAMPVATWKTYLRWNLIRQTADYLNNDFVVERFHFTGQILNGTKENRPRWKRVLGIVDRNIGDALGEIYVQKNFPPEAKVRAKEMIENLRSALHDRIQKLEWMSDATKKQALRKLAAFNVKVGYTDKWRDYSNVEIDRGPFISNILRINAYATKFDFDKIGKPVDKTQWGMTPPTVNAYYSSSENEIVFPAGILQPPFFDFKADDAVNYGGMGGVIGHEMTHGFDDQGRKFDADGNLKDWWTPEDAKNYIERSEVIRKQFDNYVAIDTLHVNGKQTLGENTADFGGLTVAYAALQKTMEGKPRPEKIDGFTPEQRFFLAWAQVWRTSFRPQALELQVKTNEHAPGYFRTIGPLANMPEFFEAFGLKDGDKMVRSGDLRAKMW